MASPGSINGEIGLERVETTVKSRMHVTHTENPEERLI